MAKRNTKKTEKEIEVRAISDLMREDYLAYSMSVIVDRALPNLTDGLKPVQRRVLYAMRNVNDYTKCARVVGAVLGRYHPHGDTAVYDALARLSQDFKMLTPYVDGHGNFGSIDGDSPAAMRYTECKMESDTKNIFFKYNQKGVKYTLNYDGKDKEPVFLATPFPTVLLNSVIGVAVGYACSIPSHNILEILNTYKAYIEGKLTINNIRKYLKAPDFPIKCNIIDSEGIDRAYKYGRGSCICHSIYEVEEGSYGRKAIIFKSVLPNRTKDSELTKIARLFKDDRSQMSSVISNLADESAGNDIRVIATLRKGVSPKSALEVLASHNIFFDKIKYSANMIVNGIPKTMGIVDIMAEYHIHHSNTIKDDITVNMNECERELHMLEGLDIVLSNLQKTVTIISTTEDVKMLKSKLTRLFPELDDSQLEYILEMKIRALMGKKKVIKSLIKEVKDKIKDYKKSLKNIDGVILEQIEETRQDFRKHKRVCNIIKQK